MINIYEIPEQTGVYGLDAHPIVSEISLKYIVWWQSGDHRVLEWFELIWIVKHLGVLNRARRCLQVYVLKFEWSEETSLVLGNHCLHQLPVDDIYYAFMWREFKSKLLIRLHCYMND